MSDEFILRPLTTDEKRNTIEVGENTYRKEFRKRLSKKEQEYTKKHLPFCARCANFDFAEAVEKYVREKNKRGVTISIRDTEIAEQLSKDLDQYGKPDRFTLLDEAEAWEPRIVGHTKTTELIGYHLNYICTVCGGEKHGKVSVFVPILDYTERKTKNKKV